MSGARCQAHEMDVALALEDGAVPDNDVPPCDGPRDVQRFGWWLCQGCADALDTLASLGRGLLSE